MRIASFIQRAVKKGEEKRRKENKINKRRNKKWTESSLKFLYTLPLQNSLRIHKGKKVSRLNAKEVELEWAKLRVEEFEDKFCALCSN